MRHRFAYLLAGTLAAVAVAVIISVNWFFSKHEDVSEDATVIDASAAAIYPRYLVSFPEIALLPDASYRFQVRHLPSVPLMFQFTPAAPSHGFPEVGDDCILTVQIYVEQEQEVYGVSEPFSDWIVEQPAMNIWHPSLRDLSFGENRLYSIDIRVAGPEESGTDWKVVPQLSGGGIELP